MDKDVFNNIFRRDGGLEGGLTDTSGTNVLNTRCTAEPSNFRDELAPDAYVDDDQATLPLSYDIFADDVTYARHGCISAAEIFGTAGNTSLAPVTISVWIYGLDYQRLEMDPTLIKALISTVNSAVACLVGDTGFSADMTPAWCDGFGSTWVEVSVQSVPAHSDGVRIKMRRIATSPEAMGELGRTIKAAIRDLTRPGTTFALKAALLRTPDHRTRNRRREVDGLCFALPASLHDSRQGILPVVLHVYKPFFWLFSFAQVPIFHVGVEVFGSEFCFSEEGVLSMRPGSWPNAKHEDNILLGSTSMSCADVFDELMQMKIEWPGDQYRLIGRNCQSFAVAFCERLRLGNCIPAQYVLFAKWSDAPWSMKWDWNPASSVLCAPVAESDKQSVCI